MFLNNVISCVANFDPITTYSIMKFYNSFLQNNIISPMNINKMFANLKFNNSQKIK